MSDKLLERIAVSLEGLLEHAKASLGGAASPKTVSTATAGAATGGAKTPTAAEKAAAKKVADDKAAAAAAAKAAADKPKGPAAGTKAPGGKHTIEQVREIIRKVANDKSLGRESAKDILRDDGGGVEKVVDLKPDKYDSVYEACEVALAGEGEGNTATKTEEEPDDFD